MTEDQVVSAIGIIARCYGEDRTYGAAKACGIIVARAHADGILDAEDVHTRVKPVIDRLGWSAFQASRFFLQFRVQISKEIGRLVGERMEREVQKRLELKLAELQNPSD